ncbi:MAG TPA: hypothetical protein DDX14_04570, partial [Cyanobacteria bacterium UBA9579]|nr:hypothetical protein [Cyanobacteria bacterium UBA9579]
MKKNYKKLSGSSLVIFILGLMTMFAFAGLVVDLGMVMATQQELQKAAETAVLSAAANMEPQKSDTGVISIDTSTVASTVADTFNKMKSSSFLINSASITSTTVKELSKAVGVEVRATANLYFMSAIGLTGVQVIAQATAISD